jgi:outer membrane protein
MEIILLKLSILTGVFILFTSSVTQAVEKGDWLIRVGPALVEPNDRSGDVDGIPNSGVRVDNKLTLGYQIAYMFTDSIAVELLGITPSNHNLSGEGSISSLGGLGDVDVFPPTLSLQYHFNNSTPFKPYVGVGINYTTFSNEETSNALDAALGGPTDLEIDDSFGFSAQVGVDYFVSESVFLNTSLWYVDIDADAELTTGNVSRDVDIDIDPWVIFIGIGKKF